MQFALVTSEGSSTHVNTLTKTRLRVSRRNLGARVWRNTKLSRSPRQRYADSCSRIASGSIVFLSEDPLVRVGDLEHVYDYAYNAPVAFGDPLGLFAVDKNCDYWGCAQKFIDEVRNECAKQANYITDPRLRGCVRNRCNGARGFQTFTCGNCSDPNAGLTTAYGSRVTTICINNLSSNPNAIPAGYFGESAIHEMAHGCNWYHGRNWTNGRGPGDGVPRDFGPDNPPNKYGEPPKQILRR